VYILYGICYASPPFSQFFLRCGAFIDRAGRRDCPVSTALMHLLSDIWSPSWYLLQHVQYFCVSTKSVISYVDKYDTFSVTLKHYSCNA